MQILQKGQLVDSVTGEVIESVNDVKDGVLENREESIAALVLKSGNLPVHIAYAREHNIPAFMVSSYTGRPPEDPNSYLNKKVYITGIVLYFSGPFTPKEPAKRDGSGFYTFLIKLSEVRRIKYQDNDKIVTLDIPTVIKCGGVKIQATIAGLIDEYGMYDFKNKVTGEPVKIPVVLSRGGENNAFWLDILPEEDEPKGPFQE